VPAQSADRPAHQIPVIVDAFDVWPTARCALVVDWTLLDADRRTLLTEERGTDGRPHPKVLTNTIVQSTRPPSAAIVPSQTVQVDANRADK